MMGKADKNMADNFDLKIKMAQILFQEKQDTNKGINYVEDALEIKPDDFDGLILYGKMLIKEKDGALAIK